MTLAGGLASVPSLLAGVSPMRVTGRLSRVVGLEAEARGLQAALGDTVRIRRGAGWVPAQVVAVREDALLLAPYGELTGVAPGAQVEVAGRGLSMRVGPDLAGRVLDALGHPIDDGPPLPGELVALDAAAPHPLKRQRIVEPLPLGVRALDTADPLRPRPARRHLRRVRRRQVDAARHARPRHRRPTSSSSA